MQPRNRSSVYCVSLGCFKNQVDSERIVGALERSGYEIVPTLAEANVCVVNTCGFLREAVEENIAVILDAGEARANGEIASLIVFGCLVNRYGAETLAKDIPEVDAWIRCEDYAGLLCALSHDSGSMPPKRSPLPSTPTHVRYLKVSEGCSNRCSYCMIPQIRGDVRSTPLSILAREAQSLVEEGARELCLVGQDLTAYGADLGDGTNLIQLIDALESSLPHDIWLRLLYLQPMGVDRALLERVANGRQVLPYLDIPIQHASGKLLTSMNRNISRDALAEIFATARRIRPDFALRTTCMVGYPGEGRADFDELLRFLDEVRFDRMGAFAFSPEEGVPAATMPQQVTARTKQRRLERLMQHQEAISAERQSLFLGKTLDILIDTVSKEGFAEGRSFREAPDVDGTIDVETASGALQPGDRIRAIVTETYEHDMCAREVP